MSQEYAHEVYFYVLMFFIRLSRSSQRAHVSYILCPLPLTTTTRSRCGAPRCRLAPLWERSDPTGKLERGVELVGGAFCRDVRTGAVEGQQTTYVNLWDLWHMGTGQVQTVASAVAARLQRLWRT